MAKPKRNQLNQKKHIWHRVNDGFRDGTTTVTNWCSSLSGSRTEERQNGTLHLLKSSYRISKRPVCPPEPLICGLSGGLVNYNRGRPISPRSKNNLQVVWRCMTHITKLALPNCHRE